MSSGAISTARLERHSVSPRPAGPLARRGQRRRRRERLDPPDRKDRVVPPLDELVVDVGVDREDAPLVARPVENVSPTVKFGTAVTNTAGSLGSPSSRLNRNLNTQPASFVIAFAISI